MPAIAILVVTVLVSVAGFSSPALIDKNLFRPYWFLPKRQYWTLITSGYIHANVQHLLFNGISYYFFAFPLQRVIGPVRFALLYLIGLVLSNTGTYFKHRKDPEYASLGASGAILAVMFAAIIYFPRVSLYMFPLPIPIPAPLYAVLYLGYTYYAARQARDRINHSAHFDGALTGIAFVAITDPEACTRAWHIVFG